MGRPHRRCRGERGGAGRGGEPASLNWAPAGPFLCLPLPHALHCHSPEVAPPRALPPLIPGMLRIRRPGQPKASPCSGSHERSP